MPIDSARAQEVFVAAAEIADCADRAAFVVNACGGDVFLKSRVEALLRAHDQSDSFLDAPLVDRTDADRSSVRDFVPKLRGDNEVPLGFLAAATQPDSLGRIGHYEALQVLGQGGFGIVFRAFDDVLHRVVAVKVLSPQMAAMSPPRKRFLREARLSAQVRHENVVQVYEVGETPLPYIAMEFIPGETLQQRLDRIGPIEASEVVRIGRQIAEGLAAAHATDLIHRDIKPANILLESGAQRVKITDFGLARAADDASGSQSGIVAGTPMYMAPEQATGTTLGQRADLFSLGSVMYVMASGRPPFRANGALAVMMRVAEDDPRPIREIIPETPQWLCDIISKLHAKNPDDRFQSAREVADVLADCEAQLKANAKLKDFSRIPKGKQSMAGKSRRWKWAAAIALLFPVVGLAAAEVTGMTNLFQSTRRTHGHLKSDSDSAAAPPSVGKSWAADTPASGGTPSPYKAPFSFAAVDRIAALPAERQIEEVRKELIRRNPGFDGKVDHKIVEGVVTEVKIVTDHVTDIAPIKVFNFLRVLKCTGTHGDKHYGLLQDLTPLEGMNLAGLTDLDLSGTSVNDAGMVCFKDCKNLTLLALERTDVGDKGLAHFKHCKALATLDLGSTRVSDVGAAHFKDCKDLTTLYLYWTKVSDAGVVHFEDCKALTELCLAGTMVSDKGLARFKNCKALTHLHVEHTQVGDAGLAHCKGMPLTSLWIDSTGVTDLRPLQGMPLEDIHLTLKNFTAQELDLLRDMKSLKTIGISWAQAWPVAEFWKRYDKGEFALASNLRNNNKN